jgi:hypothetical protein
MQSTKRIAPARNDPSEAEKTAQWLGIERQVSFWTLQCCKDKETNENVAN